MSRTIVVVLYKEGEEMMNKCYLHIDALDSMMGEELNLPVKHGKEVIGYCKKLYKKKGVIYAKVEVIGDIAYSIQQLAKKSKRDNVTITQARLFEIYI